MMSDSTDPADPADVSGQRPPARQIRERLLPGNPLSVGEDPDYRFTLANERTFLAWIRTALALSAGGLAALTVLDETSGAEFLGLGLLVLAFLTAATSYRRWALNERAMRLNAPLPPSRLPLIMTIGVSIVALIAAVVAVLGS